MNIVGVIGRLVADVMLRYTQNGTAVCSFTVAVDNPFKKDDSSFIDCVAWQKTAEFLANNVAKGCRVGVSGRLQTRIYEDKEGVKKKSTEIICEQVDVIDWAKDKQGGQEQAPEPGFDDVPF